MGRYSRVSGILHTWRWSGKPDLWWRQLCGICRCSAFHLWSTQTPYIKSVFLCSNSLCFAFFIFKRLQTSSNSSTLGVHTSADASAGASTDACAGAPVASEGSAGSAGWAGGAASEAPEAPGTSVGELGELFWELFSWEGILRNGAELGYPMDITNFWTNPVGICCAYLLMNHCDVATEACAFRKLAACLVFRQKEPRRACQLPLLRMVLDAWILRNFNKF